MISRVSPSDRGTLYSVTARHAAVADPTPCCTSASRCSGSGTTLGVILRQGGVASEAFIDALGRQLDSQAHDCAPPRTSLPRASAAGGRRGSDFLMAELGQDRAHLGSQQSVDIGAAPDEMSEGLKRHEPMDARPTACQDTVQ